MVGSLDEPRAAGSDNPNVIYRNRGCRAKFSLDLKALEQTGRTRNYNGLAIGDFNLDGYPDVVAASGYVAYPEKQSRVYNFGSPLDKTAFFTNILNLNANMTFSWTGNTLKDGDMMVQINSETNKSACWISVRPLGMQGILQKGRVNRGGLGATIIVKPKKRKPVIVPIISGDSFGSQHSPRRNFGLGRGCEGRVEILWPQGVRNRLYHVQNKEMISFPEIPCSFSGDYNDEGSYKTCVEEAVDELITHQVVSSDMARRLGKSALKARRDYLSEKGGE